LPLHSVGKVTLFSDLSPLVFELEGIFVGVCKLGGKFYAYENVCAHQGGPVCEGDTYPNSKFEPIPKSNPNKKERFTVSCPWHGVEYDIETGVCHADKELKLRSIPVLVKNNEVMVKL